MVIERNFSYFFNSLYFLKSFSLKNNVFNLNIGKIKTNQRKANQQSPIVLIGKDTHYYILVGSLSVSILYLLICTYISDFTSHTIYSLLFMPSTISLLL